MVWGQYTRYRYLFLALFFAVLLGWIGHAGYLSIFHPEEDIVLVPGQKGFLGNLNNALTFSSAEIMSPDDRITEDQIKVYEDHVVLEIDEPIWSSFTDTNSMDPLLDAGANGIEIVPASEDDIHLGDIISYKTESGIVVHRVIDIGSDEEGIYYTVKGDNNPLEDNVKVRFEDVQGIVVAVVY